MVRNLMKLIIAVIKPFKLEEVREALTAIGVQGLMVSEVKGYGRQSGHTEIYRGAEYVVNFVPKIKLELVVPDGSVAQVVDTLATTAKTGKIGDGKVFVLDVEQALRVRASEDRCNQRGQSMGKSTGPHDACLWKKLSAAVLRARST
jgi:nitrogen regulatory protein PII